MHIRPTTLHHVLPLALLAAVGCSKLTPIGISAEPGEQPDRAGAGAGPGAAADGGRASERADAGPSRAKPARKPTVIVAGTASQLSTYVGPRLGDVDGDGLDDFFLDVYEAYPDDGDTFSYGHLFYGRPDVPEELAATSSDASFEQAGDLARTLLGDINGDGLADFMLGTEQGYELVFGSRTRFSGLQARFAHGVEWRAPPVEKPGYGGFWAAPLGDVDGDGADELVVTTHTLVPNDEVANRVSSVVNVDHIVAGRKDGWPSGEWDASWAVAQLGDEPPVLENEGATTVIQRLSFHGGGDFDGDGHADLLAMGRRRMWLFYGSAEGFSGTLTTDRAAVELHWDWANHEFDLDKTIPRILGDVDADGTTDLMLPSDRSLGIVYGSRERLQGTVMLEPDLVLEADALLWSTSVGDFDGDTVPEILVIASRVPLETDGPPVIVNDVYLVTATGRHATGTYALGDADLIRTGGEPLPDEITDTAFNAYFGGDFDGDGSDDLMIGTEKLLDPSTGSALPIVYLVPGTPRAPD